MGALKQNRRTQARPDPVSSSEPPNLAGLREAARQMYAQDRCPEAEGIEFAWNLKTWRSDRLPERQQAKPGIRTSSAPSLRIRNSEVMNQPPPRRTNPNASARLATALTFNPAGAGTLLRALAGTTTSRKPSLEASLNRAGS